MRESVQEQRRKLEKSFSKRKVHRDGSVSPRDLQQGWDGGLWWAMVPRHPAHTHLVTCSEHSLSE